MRSGFVIAALLLVIVAGFGFASARSDPVVRRLDVPLGDWPGGAAPVRAVLVSDLHFCSASMPRKRVANLNQILRNLRPDVAFLAGDYVAKPDQARCAAAAFGPLLADLRPQLGTIAVLGNHDNWSDGDLIAGALQRQGATVVENGAVRAGPLVVIVSGDTTSGRAKLGGALNAARRLRAAAPGATVYLSHTPDIVRWLPPGPGVLLAGHTHCGQIVLPLIGGLFEVSQDHGNALRCGVVRYRGKTVIVTAGIGTTHVPLRIGAPPDLWVVTFGPKR